MIESNAAYCDYNIDSDDLQDRLGGGLPPGALFVIEGEYGTGKSLVAQRFCYGVLNNDYTVSYVSSESDTYSFKQQMDSLSYPVKDYLLSGKLKFYPVYPSFEKYTIDGSEFIPRLKRAKDLFSNKVIIFDTISAIHQEVKKAGNGADISAMLPFFNQKCAQGKVIILTVDPDYVSEGFLSSLRSSADVLFELQRESYGGQTDHLLYIRRFSESLGTSKDVLKFRVEAGAGFIVDITKIS